MPKNRSIEPNLQKTYLKYDVNGDNKVNITDVIVVLAHISGKKYLVSAAEKRADIDGNGFVNMSDAMLIIKAVKGK